ncbi:hypothetical protein [Azospirillum argentinense]|uniref:hypothetical protein n=1 Tax=Azospirillum argentinense TaxID=2970906 RepID=UPI0032DFCE1E
MSAALYTVHMNRLIPVYKDDGAVEERHVPETYHNLPLCTANRYREKFGDAVIEIVPTADWEARRGAMSRAEKAMQRDPTPAPRSFSVESNAEASRRRWSKSGAKTATKPGAKPARATDYADLVNTMMGRTNGEAA